MAERSIKAIVWKSIIGALATAAVGWFLGLLPAGWQAISAAALWAWNALFISISLPVIVLLPLGALVVVGIGAIWPKAAAQAPESARPLGELEQRVLGVLARADGSVYFDRAAEELQIPKLLLERALDRLLERGLIQADRPHVLYGSRIFLTPDGRDYVIEKGYPLGRGF